MVTPAIIWPITQGAAKRRTRAGMGLCQGRRCGSLIEALITGAIGIDPARLAPMTARTPARPIRVAALTRPLTAFERLEE